MTYRATRKLLPAVALASFIAVSVAAQGTDPARGRDLRIGRSYVISSTILGEDRDIQVSLPAGYDDSESTYPVVYVLDGQWYFSYGVGFTRRLAGLEQIPEVIVVGIPMHPRGRFSWLTAGATNADQFLAFLQEELLPFVHTSFRTRDHRTLMGWQYAGGFALHVLVNRPDLFEAYVAASPFPVQEDLAGGVPTILEALPRLFARHPDLDRVLYLGASEQEGVVVRGTRELSSLLEAGAPAALRWEYNEMVDESHTSTDYRTIHAGLLATFADYAPLSFPDLSTFREQGGMDFVKHYYSERAAKYGTLVNDAGKTAQGLARLAMESDDLPLFDEVLSAYATFFSEAPILAWSNRYARFYLRHQRLPEALALFRHMVRRFPGSIEAYSGLAEVHEMAGEIDAAAAAYDEAIRLAEEQEDDRLNELLKKRSEARSTKK